MNNDYISHYGILGQKWGVRRYQNEDGTLTMAGRARIKQENSYGFESRKSRKERARNQAYEREEGNRYAEEASRLEAKGKFKKADKYRQFEKASRNRERAYANGLGQDELDYGNEYVKIERDAYKKSFGNSIAYATELGVKLNSKEFKAVEQKADAFYKTYTKLRVEDIESMTGEKFSNDDIERMINSR